MNDTARQSVSIIIMPSVGVRGQEPGSSAAAPDDDSSEE